MITVNDLQDQTGKDDPHPILICIDCGAEHSANKADYFMYSNTFPFICCSEPMKLVIKRIVYEEVT